MTKKCRLCGKPHEALGLCKTHYQAYRKNKGHFSDFDEFIKYHVPWSDTPATECPICGGPCYINSLCRECHAAYVKRQDRYANVLAFIRKWNPTPDGTPVNLDDIDIEDLKDFYHNEKNPQLLRDYAAHKLTAMRSRRRGDIRLAFIEEKICDSIYENLPDTLKW